MNTISEQHLVELAQQCRRAAAQRFALSPTLWDAMTQPEALLVERLLEGGLGRTGDAGRAVFEACALGYAEALRNVTVKPSQIDAIAAQMELLSRLCDALSLAQFDDEALALTATRLEDLALRIQPGRAPRNDRPVRAVASTKRGSSAGPASGTTAAKRSPCASEKPRPAAKRRGSRKL